MTTHSIKNLIYLALFLHKYILWTFSGIAYVDVKEAERIIYYIT